MGLKWPVLIYLRLARKREMESREDEAKRGDDRLHPIVPRLDSTILRDWKVREQDGGDGIAAINNTAIDAFKGVGYRTRLST